MPSVGAIDIQGLHHGRDALAQVLELPIQAGVAMSSCEAEFYGAVKGARSGVGMKALCCDIGYNVPLRLWADSWVAVGICSRQELGKLRHPERASLWIQQSIGHCELEVRKIGGG